MKNFSLTIVGLFFCFIGLFTTNHVYSQPYKILSAWNNYHKLLPVEKLYLHTDEPYYSIGDTLWYKAYLLNADFLDAATKSGLLYVELISDSGKLIKRQLIPVQQGISWGDIPLNDTDFKEGVYTLRAYTNWMRNFGQTCFFTKQIQLYHPAKEHWLVKAASEQAKGSVISHFRLSQMNGDPLILHEVGLKVMNSGRNIFKGKADTKLDGSLDVDFAAPDKPGNLTLQLKDLRPGEGNQQLDIPIVLNRPEYTDLQFMPEGGNLVSGLPSRIGFKAIGENGQSVEVSGKVYNSKQQEVAGFNSTHLGMGNFAIVPSEGETYTAKLSEPQGNTRTFELPRTKPSGTVIAVTEIESGDSLKIKVMASKDQPADNIYYLTGQSHNLVCYAASVQLKASEALFSIPKSAFPSGVARFSLLSRDMAPLNERLVYIDHHDHLNIRINPSRPSYKTYDSVALIIEVKDETGKPVRGSFSLAVTDDRQVKPDTSNTIVTHMLLTSDLKGEIEDPAYYFTGSGEALKNLDNLLLTQGWTGYDWKNVFSPQHTEPLYAAEPEYQIKGKVTNAFNHPVKGSNVSLLSKKPLLILDTLTNAQGEFTFKGVNPVDTAMFFIQARNKSGDSMNVGIEMNEFKAPAFISIQNHITPWYVNTDTSGLIYAKTELAKRKTIDKLLATGKVLKEVSISAKKIIKGSHNLNGPGEADQVIDKEELEKAGKMSLGDLLKSKIKRFRPGIFPPYSTTQSYLITDKEVRLVIDGIDVDYFYIPTRGSDNERFEYLDTFLNYYTAEDIKGIEVMYSTKYNVEYRSQLLSLDEQLKYNPLKLDLAFIEITTRSGHGPFTKATPGTYLYKPIPLSIPMQFYKPKYAAKQPKETNDFRSTIHWEPNIVTDSNGKAAITFFTAGYSGPYSVIMQGANMNGNIGFTKKELNVLPRELKLTK